MKLWEDLLINRNYWFTKSFNRNASNQSPDLNRYSKLKPKKTKNEKK